MGNFYIRCSLLSKQKIRQDTHIMAIASKFPVFRLDKATIGEMDRKDDKLP
jgi:hypothetical protein